MTNEKRIWDFLWERIGNAFGVAGLMGNLYAESALKPTNLQGTYEKKLGMTDDSYTKAVDDGTYTNFVKDAAGYGLAQWTYWTRKQNLLAFAREKGTSIGDLEMQLEFLWKELGSYKSVLKTLIAATSVQEASDAVLLNYEKPKNQGDSVKMARAKYGQKYYDAYAVQPAPQKAEGSDNSMFTNLDLAAFCLAVYAAKWVYWYGTCGYKCTTSLYNSKKNQYPSHYTAARESGYKKDISDGKMCADCVGLIKAFFWLSGKLDGTKKYGANNCPDKSANGMYKLCVKTGPISTIPDVPGLVVWKDGHIGVYVGEGYTVEMKGFNYDCVKAKVTSGKWTNWGQLPASMLNYVEGAVEIVTYKLGDRELTKGDKGEDVTELQKLLLEKGYDLGKYGADGDFGSKTLAAVKAFQTDKGLTVTGTVNADTLKALTGADEAPIEDEPAFPSGTKVVTITGDSVNARIGDAQQYDTTGHVHKGDTFEWVATSPATGWHAIRMEKRIAWVSPNYSKVKEE